MSKASMEATLISPARINNPYYSLIQWPTAATFAKFRSRIANTHLQSIEGFQLFTASRQNNGLFLDEFKGFSSILIQLIIATL
jgi:hypothetical protein